MNRVKDVLLSIAINFENGIKDYIEPFPIAAINFTTEEWSDCIDTTEKNFLLVTGRKLKDETFNYLYEIIEQM